MRVRAIKASVRVELRCEKSSPAIFEIRELVIVRNHGQQNGEPPSGNSGEERKLTLRSYSTSHFLPSQNLRA